MGRHTFLPGCRTSPLVFCILLSGNLREGEGGEFARRQGEGQPLPMWSRQTLEGQVTKDLGGFPVSCLAQLSGFAPSPKPPSPQAGDCRDY